MVRDRETIEKELAVARTNLKQQERVLKSGSAPSLDPALRVEELKRHVRELETELASTEQADIGRASVDIGRASVDIDHASADIGRASADIRPASQAPEPTALPEPPTDTPRYDETTEEKSKELDFLRSQLKKARDNLRLIEERKAEYVLQVNVPFQLIKAERRWRERIAELERKLEM
jgi:hypothetical protein